MSIPDENIVAEIRMPDTSGVHCLTFVLDRDRQVHCWPEFGDSVTIDPAKLGAVANAVAILREICTLGCSKTFEGIVHGR